MFPAFVCKQTVGRSVQQGGIILRKISSRTATGNWVIPYQIDQKYQMLVGTISDFDETFHTCTSI